MNDKSFSVGLDVGRYSISVCIMRSDGEPVKEFNIKNLHTGYNRLMAELDRLRKAGKDVCVAMEGHGGDAAPLDSYLLSKDYPLSSIHPVQLRRYKEIFGKLGRDDRHDARAAADFLRTNSRHCLELVRVDPLDHNIKRLSRLRSDLTHKKTEMTNKLHSVLSQYWPEYAAAHIFSKITTNSSLQLLNHYPDPHSLRGVHTKTIAKLLQKHSKGRLGREQAVKLKQLAKELPQQNLYHQVHVVEVKIYVQQLLMLNEQIAALDKELKQLAAKSCSVQTLMQMPGCGLTLATQIVGEIGSAKNFNNDNKLAQYCGLAPVNERSGTLSKTYTTNRCNIRAKSALLTMALLAIKYDPRARAYYLKKLREGKRHNQAVRALARHLLRLIFKRLKIANNPQPQLSLAA